MLKEHTTHYTPENTPGMAIDFAKGTWQILQCRGCDEVVFREEWEDSESIQPSGALIASEKFYPPRSQDYIPIKYIYGAPKNIARIYRESVDAYNNDLYTLCSAGLRAVIEGICGEENIKSGSVLQKQKDGTRKPIKKRNLEGKIAGLHEKGLLTKSHAAILHQHRYLGNDALHGLDCPTRDELQLAIEIIEHTLMNIYEIKVKGERLRSKKNIRKGKK
jgi:hypothetical protein